MIPDLEQARTFLELLDPEADAFTFQTFDDTRQVAELARGAAWLARRSRADG